MTTPADKTPVAPEHNHPVDDRYVVEGCPACAWPPVAPDEGRPRTAAGRRMLRYYPEHIKDIRAIEDEAAAEARAGAREADMTLPWDRPKDHVRTPEGPDDYCTGCGELWPCSFEQGRAEARAGVEGLRERIERLPRFGVVDGRLVPHTRGIVVQLDAVRAALAAATPKEPSE